MSVIDKDIMAGTVIMPYTCSEAIQFLPDEDIQIASHSEAMLLLPNEDIHIASHSEAMLFLPYEDIHIAIVTVKQYYSYLKKICT